MLIAYRRMSGAIGVTDDEKGARGLWWEKRRALIRYLELRGHTVEFINRMTQKSQHVPHSSFIKPEHEVLMIEFGSSNFVFYGPDLKQTEELIAKFKGRTIIFICDDPDLPFTWRNDLPQLNKFVCWYNCTHPKPFGGQPYAVPSYDFPFSSIQHGLEPIEDYDKSGLVYIGRPFGREKAVRELIANKVPFQAFAKPTEWEEFGVFVRTPPDQPMRSEFYRKSLGCLVLADQKHKTLGWRTGRGFHALLSGCPAVAEHDHPAMSFLDTYQNPKELHKLIEKWKDPDARYNSWKSQMHGNWYNMNIADATAEKCGL